MASYLLLFFVLLLPLLLLLKLKPAFKSENRVPPGPWTLPIIGCIHHFAGRGLPHHALHTLSGRYGHLMSLKLGEIQTIVVSSKEGAREILKTQDINFCTRPVNSTIKFVTYDTRDVAFAPYGEYWKEIRKICALELFSMKRVFSFKSIREDEVENLIQQIKSLSTTGQYINISEKLFKLTNDVIIQAIMGSKTREQDLYLREYQKLLEFIANFDIANFFPSFHLIISMLTGTTRRAKEFRDNMDRIFQNIMREQSEKEHADAENLLTVLLRLKDEYSDDSVLSMESIKAVILDVLAAGTDTSASTMDWVMAELIKNPRVMKKMQIKLRQDFQGYDHIITESDLGQQHYLHLIIKETLRLHPVVPLLPRECLKTCNILGYNISKGTIVIVNAWAMGRDSNYWKDAEEFKPERFEEGDADVNFNGGDFEFIPFGAGRRMCPGMSFALATMELVLANLLYHFDWELPPGTKSDELDMTETYGAAVRKKSPLCLRAIPYKY